MFYSGATPFVESVGIIFMFFLLFCKITTYQFSLKFDHTGLADSIPLLNIVSSPIFTLMLFYMCLIYMSSSKRTRSSNYILVLILIFNYYFIHNRGGAEARNIFATTAVNLTLQNGLLNIHPYIVYQLYGFICIYTLSRVSKVRTYHQYYFNPNLLKSINLLILIGIFLGAWWAAQEFNWGGFWSWDPVELISLLILLFTLNLQHRNLNNFSFSYARYYLLLMTVIYCIMRLGLVSTIHSFIKNTSTPYYAYCIFLSLLWFCLWCFQKYLVYGSSTDVNTRSQYTVTQYFNFSIIILSLFFVTLILINFNAISHYFLFSLSMLYFTILMISCVKVLLIDSKLSKTALVGLLLLVVFSYYIFDLYFIFCSSVLLLFRTKRSWTVHFVVFLLYVTAVFFLSPLAQGYKAFSPYMMSYSLTDHYTNLISNNTFVSNFFIKKNSFTLKLKNYIHHGSGFITYTTYVLSQFLTIRNNIVSITYSEEFIFFVVLLCILICIYNYTNWVRWNITFY